jgi:RNA polymerase sigma-70 factor (ECF subfamily)
MAEELTFEQLICRIREGDQAAAAELVRRYEPAVRRAVRFRLGDGRLGAVLDSMDVCQSVLGSFFVRVAAGQYDLKTPEQLLKLLATMARNKVAGQARKESAERRDYRRVRGGDAVTAAASGDPSPSRELAARELLDEVNRRLTAEERRLVELRSQGGDWAAIALRVGGDPVVLRKRLSRALDRVTREMGLDSDE